MTRCFAVRVSAVLVVLLLGFPRVVPAERPRSLAHQDDRTPFDATNPFIGTGGEGHTHSGATMPFGMPQLSPETDVRSWQESYPSAAGYRYRDRSALGFAHTHFSDTGHSDLGDVLLIPTVLPPRLEPSSADKPGTGYRSQFSHDQKSAAPGYYSVQLQDPGIRAELTAINRVGVHPPDRDAASDPGRANLRGTLGASFHAVASTRRRSSGSW